MVNLTEYFHNYFQIIYYLILIDLKLSQEMIQLFFTLSVSERTNVKWREEDKDRYIGLKLNHCWELAL